MAIEDFTTYTETDTDTKITVAAASVSWASYERNDEGYVRKDYGSGYFAGDLRIAFEINVSAGTQGGTLFLGAPFNLTNTIGTWDDQGTDDRLSVIVRENTVSNQKELIIHDVESGSGDESSGITITHGTTYYCIFERVGTTARLTARTGSHRGTGAGVVTNSLSSAVSYQYLQVAVSADTASSGTDNMSGSISNLDLNPPVYNTEPCHFKPPFGSVIDWGHPLAQGLEAYWLMNEGSGEETRDLTGGGRDQDLSDTGAWVKTMGGHGYDAAGGDDGEFSPATSLAGDFTLFWWTHLTGASYDKLADGNGGSDYVRLNSTTALRVAIGGSTTTMTHGHTFGDGVEFIVVRRSGSTISVYRNGVTPSSTGSLSGTLQLDHFNHYTLLGPVISSGYYDRALTPHEIRTLYAMPYCFIKGPSRVALWEAAGGGAPPVGAHAGPLVNAHRLKSKLGGLVA